MTTRLAYNSERERRIRAETLYWCRTMRPPPDDLPPERPFDGACPDCAVADGDLHMLGCGIEQCAEHRQQVLSCYDAVECALSSDAWHVGL